MRKKNNKKQQRVLALVLSLCLIQIPTFSSTSNPYSNPSLPNNRHRQTQYNNNQHNNTQRKKHFVQSFVKCMSNVANQPFMLSVVMPSVFLLNVVQLLNSLSLSLSWLFSHSQNNSLSLSLSFANYTKRLSLSLSITHNQTLSFSYIFNRTFTLFFSLSLSGSHAHIL